jgi:dTDP-4-amino-4,6-dideoxygalactose transaminase
MDAIMDVARRHGLFVVEDCAQSYLCYYKGRLAGTIGDIGCFSTNDFKHISTGDGGLAVMNDEALFQKATMFADKNYNRFGSANASRECELLAPNYRMTELQGAVGIAQLERLEAICSKRSAYGDRITEGIGDLAGIHPHKVLEGGKSSYWFYMFRIDETAAGVSRDRFCEAVSAEGVPLSAGYIPTCVYEYPIFRDRRARPGTHSPFDSVYYGREIEYGKGLCPVAEEILATSAVFRVKEYFSERDIDDVVAAIRKVSRHFAPK